MKYAAEMGSGATIFIPSFVKIGLDIHKLMGGYIFYAAHLVSRERRRLVLPKTPCFNIILPSIPRFPK
jgi:hypothetical protein